MKFSYQDLNNYFVDPLPKVEAVAEALITHAFEVDDIVSVGNDWELEIKILPDRSHDASQSLGLARELSAILNQGLKEEYLVDNSQPRCDIVFTVKKINDILGLDLSEEQIIDYLKRVRVKVVKNAGDNLLAQIPNDRLDLNIKEDLADEVVRLHGYNKVPALTLVDIKRPVVDSVNFTLANQLRQFFIERGFTEIYGYTFKNKGQVKVAKPLASDKAWLRTDLSSGLIEYLQFNLKHLLFDNDNVKLFEIGTVFQSLDQEAKVFSFGLAYKKSKLANNFKEIDDIIAALAKTFTLSIDKVKLDKKEALVVAQVSLADLELKPESLANLNPYLKKDDNYVPVSSYPWIVRDVAVFVLPGTDVQEVETIIKNEATSLLAIGPILFDDFTKEGRRSLAFRLAFQSAERTLLDDEINLIMDKIIVALEKNEDFIVRN